MFSSLNLSLAFYEREDFTAYRPLHESAFCHGSAWFGWLLLSVLSEESLLECCECGRVKNSLSLVTVWDCLCLDTVQV